MTVRVVMVDVKATLPAGQPATDGAPATLGLGHRLNLLNGKAVSLQ